MTPLWGFRHMVDVQVLDRLSAVAARKRWVVGLSIGPRSRLRAALLGIEGLGLASRAEVFAWRQARLSVDIRHSFERLRRGRACKPLEAALVAAQLAESAAALVDELSAEVAPVWNRVLALAVNGPALGRRYRGFALHVNLCDPARLAEMTGQNVIDDFPARDRAQDGAGRPLAPLPYWMLLHDAQRNRLLVERGPAPRLTYLPASRDTTGAQRLMYWRLGMPQTTPTDDSAWLQATLESIPGGLATVPRVDEMVMSRWSRPTDAPPDEPGESVLPRVVTLNQLGIPAAALRPAAVGLLGLLHLDQTPANVPSVTGARAPRVLGRLTPGSWTAWQRLLRDLAAAKPGVVALRSAV